MRRRALAIASVAFCIASPARAWFESTQSGTRALGLANAFVSVADDPSAVYWNPAGLVQLRRHDVLLSFDHTSDLDGLRNGFAAVAMRTPRLAFGVGWQRTSLAEAASEDLWSVSVAGAPIRRSLGAFVACGATLEIARVGLETETAPAGISLLSSDTHVAANVGLLMAPIPNVFLGGVFRHLGEPRFDLVSGGDVTVLEREFEWGASFRWRRDAWLHFGRVQHPGNGTSTRIGAELRVVEPLGVRFGLDGGTVAGGLDLRVGRWIFESAMRAHDALGITYRAGLRIGFGREQPGVGGTYDEF